MFVKRPGEPRAGQLVICSEKSPLISVGKWQDFVSERYGQLWEISEHGSDFDLLQMVIALFYK